MMRGREWGGLYPRGTENRLETRWGGAGTGSAVPRSRLLRAARKPRGALGSLLMCGKRHNLLSMACRYVHTATLTVGHMCRRVTRRGLFLSLSHSFKFSKPCGPMPSKAFFKGNSFLPNFSSATFFSAAPLECA